MGELPDRAIPGARFMTSDATRVRRVAIITWGVALIVQIAVAGVPLDRLGVMIWTATGLVAASIGRRPLWTVLIDWAPFAAVLIVYDRIGRLANTIGMPVMWKQPADIDRAMFGTVPTVWLQNHLKLAHPPAWEGLVSLTYTSFFLMPYVVAGVLWLRGRMAFRQWALRFVTMSFLGLACFIIIPSAPPWAAAACRPVDVADRSPDPVCIYFSAQYAGKDSLLGALHPADHAANPWVERLSTRGWQVLHLPVAKHFFDKSQSAVDMVAAVPSLHAGCTLLFVIFAWTRVRKRWRPLLAAYALVMAFSLVYSGEHYVVDILAGWLLAVAVSVGFARFERRAGRQVPDDVTEVDADRLVPA
jgi:membrane-associated phospholipid phosphatase